MDNLARLLAVLLVILSLLIAPTAEAETVKFRYVRAIEYDDGAPMPVEEIAETVLYCNGDLVTSEIGADETFTVILDPGSYACYATHIDIAGEESEPSEIITKVVVEAGTRRRPRRPRRLE